MCRALDDPPLIASSPLSAKLESRSRRAGAAVTLSGLATVLGLIGWIMSQQRSPTSLDMTELFRLADSGHFDESLSRIEDVLRVDPGNVRLHVIAAELSLDRPDPEPRRALEHALSVHGGDPSWMARAEVAAGKALYLQQRYDDAETHWLAALRLDPKVPEASWALLDLYYLQGRTDESCELALRQHRIESDRGDRVQFLVELLRQDAEPPDPASVAMRFGPVAAARPRDLRTKLVLAEALIHCSRIDEGVEILEDALQQARDSPDVWRLWLEGLALIGDHARLSNSWREAPSGVRADSRLACQAGDIAWASGDRNGAVTAYRRAWSSRPHDLVAAYRLARALRALGQDDQAGEIDRFLERAKSAKQESGVLYGLLRPFKQAERYPSPDLCRRVATNRERLGRSKEGEAWSKLASGHSPGPLCR
jgi:tetratricopeptide (TPR) repeat protein